VIVCEYFFKEFYSRGSDEYLNAWAAEVDRMGGQGWQVLDSTRRAKRPGVWTVVLVRPAPELGAHGMRSDRSEDSKGWESY
jgi:hypothetical protein